MLLILNMVATLKIFKKRLSKEYEMKNLGNIKTIIGWQITRDPIMHTMNIDLSIFIRDLVIEKRLIDCNANVTPMKVRSAIEITDPEGYKETELREYQRLISKLIYLVCGTRLDIVFTIGQLSKDNAISRKGHF